MNALTTIRLVAMREITERVASRAFQISTAVTLLIVVGLLIAPTLFGGSDEITYSIGTFGERPPDLVESVEATATTVEETTVEVTTTAYDTEDALRLAVSDDEVDIGLVDDTVVLSGPATPSSLTNYLVTALSNTAIQEEAAELGLSSEDLATLLAGGPTIEEIDAEEGDEGRLVVAFIGTILLFVSIVSYGQWILIGVVEEKSSRVVEVILGAVRPRHLLAGKVLGIGLLGLGQLLLISVIGVVGIQMIDQIDVPGLGAGIVLIVMGWFLLGFAFYATGFAIAGSLVSRQEDAQNAAFPLTMVMMVGYFVGTSALSTGGSNVAVRVLSLIPPFSPLTMPLRQATGDAAAWEVVLSVTLMVVAVFGMLRIGGRVYAGGLLRSGRRVKAREAFRGAEH